MSGLSILSPGIDGRTGGTITRENRRWRKCEQIHKRIHKGKVTINKGSE